MKLMMMVTQSSIDNHKMFMAQAPRLLDLSKEHLYWWKVYDKLVYTSNHFLNPSNPSSSIWTLFIWTLVMALCSSKNSFGINVLRHRKS
jgi:hypothetical protein